MPTHKSVDDHVKQWPLSIVKKWLKKERRLAKANKEKMDTKAHVTTVKTAIEAWAEVDEAGIEVADISGRSWNKTFRVTAPGEADPKTVILAVNKEAVAEQESHERLLAVQKVVAEAGLTGARLSGDDAFEVTISGDSGTPVPADKTHKDLAELLAKVHAVDPAWFDATKEKAGEKHECLKEAIAGAPIWWFATHAAMLEGMDEEKLKDWAADCYEPLSEAGKKVVTCHGMYERENVLVKADGALQVVDFEWSYAGWAALDIAFHFLVTPHTPVQKKEFVLAYLKGTGVEEENEEETNKLLFDCEMQSIRVAYYSGKLLTMLAIEKDKKYDGCIWTHMKAFEEKAREDAELQTSVVNLGAWGAATDKMDETFKKDWDKHGKMYLGGGGGCCNCVVF